MPLLRPALGAAVTLAVLVPATAVVPVATALPAAPWLESSAEVAAGATTSALDADAPLLDGARHGRTAIRDLGDRLDEAAAVNDLRPRRLRRLLTEDGSAWISARGRMFYVDRLAVEDGVTTPRAATAGAAFGSATPGPPADVFALHSDPDASHKVFLDVDGMHVADTFWNDPTQFTMADTADGTMPERFYAGFSLDADPTTFTEAEKAAIAEIWRQVAEMYAPFRVDVTTEDPGPDDLIRTGSGDDAFGEHVLVTSESAARSLLCGSCAGIALMDTFSEIDAENYLTPAWVFASATGNDPMLTAQTVVHEVGHTLGLHHDGTTAAGEDSYSGGHGNWHPVMGFTIGRPISHFSRGEYHDANNTEDDLAIIAAGGAPARADDAGGTPATATPLTGPVSGMIGDRDDADVYALPPGCAGEITATARGSGVGSPLDLEVALLDGTGTVVDSADPPSGWGGSLTPATGLDAELTATVDATVRYLRVDGVGAGDPYTTNVSAIGYTDYGSIGRYTLAVTGCPLAPTGAVPSAPRQPAATGDHADGLVTWEPPASIGDGPLLGYRVTVDAEVHDVDATLTSLALSGLQGGRSYAVQVRAINEHGSSPPATTTLVNAPWAPSGPPSVTARDVDPVERTARVEWSLDSSPTANPGNAVLTGWSLHLSTETGRSLEEDLPAATTAVLAGGLPPGAVTASVTPVFEPGTLGTPVPGAVTFTMPRVPSTGSTTPTAPPPGAALGRPSRPALRTVRRGGPGKPVTVRVRWRPAAGASAAITGWRLQVGRVAAKGKAKKKGKVKRWRGAGVLPASARRAEPKVRKGRYRVRVRALSVRGASAWSAPSRPVRAR